jgi:hypothetical protein
VGGGRLHEGRCAVVEETQHNKQEMLNTQTLGGKCKGFVGILQKPEIKTKSSSQVLVLISHRDPTTGCEYP